MLLLVRCLGNVTCRDVPRVPPSVTWFLLFSPLRVDQAVYNCPPWGGPPLAPGVLQCRRYGGSPFFYLQTRPSGGVRCRWGPEVEGGPRELWGGALELYLSHPTPF